MQPTHQLEPSSVLGSPLRSLLRDGAWKRLDSIRRGVSRKRATRRTALFTSLLLLLGVNVVVDGLRVRSAQAASLAGRPTEALSGPWRWLEPDLESLRLTTRLAAGPWQEVAITRDPARREWLLEKFGQESETIAPKRDRSDGVDGFRESPRPTARTKPSILRRATLESARLLEAAGEPAAAAEAYAGRPLLRG